MQPFAEMLDAAYGGDQYAMALHVLRQRIDHPESTPSAQVLDGVRAHGGFAPYTLQLSQQHHARLLAQPLDEVASANFQASVQVSWQNLQRLEAQDQGSFDDYVARYYA